MICINFFAIEISQKIDSIKLNEFSTMFCNVSSTTTDEEEQFYKEIRFWVNGIFGGSLGVVGLVMNTLTLIILRTMSEWKHMMNYLLSLLLLVNNIYLITQIINILAYGLADFGFDGLMVIVPNLVYPIEKTVLTMGVFFTVSLAHQAYLLTWEYDEYNMMSSSQEYGYYLVCMCPPLVI